MSVITRKEKFMAAAATGDLSGLPAPLTRQEAYLLQITKGKTDRFLAPVTRREGYLHAMCVGRTDGLPRPVTREERFLYAAAIGDAEGVPDPITRTEICLKAIAEGSGGGGGGPITEGEFGIEWNYSAPSPALTRTGDAVGFADPVPATTLTEVGSSPFDNIMPWAGMRMCNIIDGEIEYWQGDPQFSETDYDTMVYIPDFWYKAEKNTDTSKWNWSISPSEKEGYAKHPGSGRYISRFHLSGSDSALFSKSGFLPIGSITRADFRTYSHNKGDNWWLCDMATWSAIQLLYLIEFANFNSQAKLGNGPTGPGNIASGDTTGASYHTISRNGASNAYRWIEDPFANGYIYLDGFLKSGGAYYVGTDNATFTDNASSLNATGVSRPTKDGAISGFGYSSVFPWAFLPDTVVTASNDPKYVTDQAIVKDNDNTTLLVGSSNTTWVGAGLFLFASNGIASKTDPYQCARFIFIP